MNLEILEFIQGHYITPRADTEFWKKIRYDTPIIPSLQEKIDNLKEYNLLGIRNHDLFVGLSAWLIMGAGQKILDIGKIREHKKSKMFHPEFEMFYNGLKKNITSFSNKCVSHDDFLKLMKERK